MSHLRIYGARILAVALLVILLLTIIQDAAHASGSSQAGELIGMPNVHDLVIPASGQQPVAQAIQPHAYLIILDVTTSMSWNFAS